MTYTHRLHSASKATKSDRYGYRDVKQEHDQDSCEVEGIIPSWISGTFYRQAGGAFGKQYSDLDGLAHIVAFRIEQGQVFFSNRFLRTADYAAFVNKGERTWGGTGKTTPPSGIFSRVKDSLKTLFWASIQSERFPTSAVKYTDFNPNVTMWLLEGGNTLAAQTEVGGVVCAFDKEDLETTATVRVLKPGIRRAILITTPAHFFREGGNGGYHVGLELAINWKLLNPMNPELTFYYTIHIGDNPPLRCVYQHKLVTFRYNDRAQLNEQLESRPSYMHTVAKTKQYLILFLSSRKWDVAKLLSRDFSGGLFDLVPSTTCPLHFMVFKANQAGEVKYIDTFRSKTRGTMWHIANCYEDDEQRIIIDGTLPLSNSEGEGNAIGRIVLDLITKEVSVTPLTSTAMKKSGYEFPCINPTYFQMPYQHTYCVRNALSASATVVKLSRDEQSDNCELSEAVLEWFTEKGEVPSEPAFLPAPGGSAEDDGVILTMVTNANRGESYLAILCASTGKVLAKVRSPIAINRGVHSIFIPRTPTFLVSKY